MTEQLVQIGVYAPSNFCSSCGDCCKHYPGSFLPQDFGTSQQEVMAAVERGLTEGNFNLDYWEGGHQTMWFVRPCTLDSTDRIVDPTWGGRCHYLGVDGCKAPLKPSMCAALKPEEDKRCHYPFLGKPEVNGKHFSALSWENYWDALDALVERLRTA